MADEKDLSAAETRFKAAGEGLASAVEARLAREAVLVEVEAEIQRMTADRGRLARELDSAMARGERLEKANKAVSQRLVDAMERIRDIVGRQKEAG